MISSETRRYTRFWGHAASVAFVVVCLVLVEQWIGWGSLLAPWSGLSPLAILAAISLMLLTYVTRALRLYRHFGAGIDFMLCLRLLAQHNLLINVLPMRTGEVAFPILMQRYFEISALRSVSTLLWFRALDLHALTLVLAAAIIWPYEPVLAGVFAVLWISLLFVVYFHATVIMRWLGKRDDRLSQKLCEALAALPQSGAAFTESCFWTLTSWILKLMVFAFILSLFVSLNFPRSLIGAIGGEISSVLPIHGPAGIGTYQAGVAAAVTPFGLSLQQALRGGINLHLFVLGVSILGGLLAMIAPRRAQSILGRNDAIRVRE